MNSFLLCTYTLLRREVARFIRQKHRIVGALGTPLVFWFLIGSGLKNSFQVPGSPFAPNSSATFNYLDYFFPGTIVMILLFTAIFSTISIIEDRKEGFLQGVLVAPVPTPSIVLGKILGGSLLATFHGALFMVLAPLLKIRIGFPELLFALVIMFALSFGLTGLGVLMAWKMNSTQGFHAIMNLFLMPLWFLSGALFPQQGAPLWLKGLMAVNPLSYGVAALHRAFFVGLGSPDPSYPAAFTCFMIVVVFSLCMFALSTFAAARSRIQ